MKKLDAAGRGRLWFAAVFFLAGIFPWLLYAQTASPELIVDICTTPHRYWNKYVMLKGHVHSATANPPGTNRGSYVLRDSSDTDITVLTPDLPAQGKEYTVYGNVEQTNPDSKIPVIREFQRTSGNEAAPRQTVRPRRVVPSEEAPYETAPVQRRDVQQSPAPPVSQPAPTPAAAQPAQPPVAVQPTVVPPAPQAESSGLSMTLIIAILGIAALIVIAIIVMVMRPKKPAPASYAPPMTTAAPSHIRPPAPPPPTSRRTASAASQAAAATQVVPPPAPKATEVYFDLGMELAVTDGPDKGKRFPITKLAVTMGRSGARQNDVTLSDGTVSREHAKIIYSTSEKTFRLINESTTNPARLNGNPIDAAVLNEGDAIQVGATILKFSKKA